MTAPYVPPQQPVYPAPQYQQQSGYPQQPPPGYGAPPPTQQPGYAPPPAYPQQQQPYYPPAGTDPNTRLSGPNIPQELQGKTVGEALRYYGIMREDFVRRQTAQQQQQPMQGQPQQQPPQYQQPQQQPSAQPRGQQQQPGAGDPMRQYVSDAIREVMPEFLAPVVQPLQQQNLARVYQEVRGRYQDWGNYEGEILQSLQGADMATLSNPNAWDAAYKHAVGNALVRSRQPQQPQGPPQPQYQQQQQYPQPQYQPQQPQYPQQQGYPQAPQQPQTFVEGPTPPAPQGGPGGQGQDPRDEMMARRFGVPLEVYRSWKGGRVGLLPQPGQSIPSQDVWGNVRPPQQPPAGYPPQQYNPQPYQAPTPPGFYQPPVNGAGYGY